VQVGLNCKLQVSEGQCRSVQVSAGQCRSVQVSAGQCRSVQVSAGQCRSVQVSAGQVILFVNEEQHNNTFRFVNYKLQPLSILVILTKS
jgi:microcystin degradation protein MlrC